MIKTKILVAVFFISSGLCIAQISVPIEINPFPEKTTKVTVKEDLEGLWELTYIYDKFKPCEELFPEKKPTLYFDPAHRKAFGNTGCNLFSILTYLEGNGIEVLEFTGMTEKWCEGEGEDIFLTILKSAHRFKINNKGELSLSFANLEIMRLKKISDVSDSSSEFPKIIALVKPKF